ncbi:DUF7305 domain-containing protein [Rummeliibacillus stabekisii]|uniref:DUF7305 domain-containing protein n=1 Tax=Rummeliibacillus stabekisii TaxID=241244 RepID=UPI00116D30C5|nr:hypothetical protein [Rummeliibacillus stabekisii]MBB5168847.1 type II secretory pathway pseudopilin PulG [Rummeliibacillus stabekisii]GEL05009.1 hypothetical protein RST01_16360 [Rummeliibacillus stabekisii]
MRKISKYLKPLKNNKGYTLILSVFVIAVISILALSLMSTTATTMKQADHERIDQAAYYIAESGITQTKEDLDKKVYAAYNSIKNIYEKLSPENKAKYNFEGEFYKLVLNNISQTSNTIGAFEKNFGTTPEAKVTVTNTNNSGPLVYKLSSDGIIGSEKRTVSQNYKIIFNADNAETGDVSQNLSSKYAVHVLNKFSLENDGIKINGGEVALEKNKSESIVSLPTHAGYKPPVIKYSIPINIHLPEFPSEKFTELEKLPYPPDQEIQKDQWNTTKVINNHDLLITNNISNKYKLTMSTNMKFNDIKLNENNVLFIDTGNSDKSILVNNLDLTNGHIKILGTGKLTLYVKNKIITGSGSTLNETNNVKDISNLKIFYKGSEPITTSGDQKIYGSLYAEKADINIAAGSGFQGNIYTGGTKVSISGGTRVNTQMFLAPNADFSIYEGGQFKGAIIAKTFKASGGPTIIFDPNNSIESESNSYKNYEENPNKLTSLDGTLKEK